MDNGYSIGPRFLFAHHLAAGIPRGLPQSNRNIVAEFIIGLTKVEIVLGLDDWSISFIERWQFC
jgi:hypothetical protein